MNIINPNKSIETLPFSLSFLKIRYVNKEKLLTLLLEVVI
ncbi:hypothetical protein KF134_1225 [Lactococcus lactis subsp. lactis]|nr:hypothetical protein KF134_1225 [Lactococcus lactis subsp. lactis]